LQVLLELTTQFEVLADRNRTFRPYIEMYNTNDVVTISNLISVDKIYIFWLVSLLLYFLHYIFNTLFKNINLI